VQDERRQISFMICTELQLYSNIHTMVRPSKTRYTHENAISPCRGLAHSIILLRVHTRSYLALTSLKCFPEHPHVKRQRLAHPSRPLRMISQVIAGVGMNECRQWTPVDHEPWNECAKLLWTTISQPFNPSLTMYIPGVNKLTSNIARGWGPIGLSQTLYILNSGTWKKHYQPTDPFYEHRYLHSRLMRSHSWVANSDSTSSLWRKYMWMSKPPRMPFVMGDMNELYASLFLSEEGLTYDLPSSAFSLVEF
jgi:hypothetical protein